MAVLPSMVTILRRLNCPCMLLLSQNSAINGRGIKPRLAHGVNSFAVCQGVHASREGRLASSCGFSIVRWKLSGPDERRLHPAHNELQLSELRPAWRAW